MPRLKNSTQAERYTTTQQFTSPLSVRLAELMNAKIDKIGREQLANELDVSVRMVDLWKGKKSRPDIDRLPQLAEYFNVSCDYLLGRHDDKEPKIEVQAIRNYTGLDSNAIDFLARLKNVAMYENAQKFLSTLIANFGDIIPSIEYMCECDNRQISKEMPTDTKAGSLYFKDEQSFRNHRSTFIDENGCVTLGGRAGGNYFSSEVARAFALLLYKLREVETDVQT